MYQPSDDERQKLFNEIAKLLVENTTLREYIKSLSHDDKSFDSVILIELKILAQRIDLLDGLASTPGETLLEKATNYLSKSRILQDIEDSKLKAFLQALSSLLEAAKKPVVSVQPTQHVLDVSASGSNCGVFALALGIKIALDHQSVNAATYAAVDFLREIPAETLQHATRETDETGKMLRSSLASALKANAGYKARRFESFVTCCATYLEYADFSKLDKISYQALYEANSGEIEALYSIWSKKIVPRGFTPEQIEEHLAIVDQQNVSADIVPCYQRMLTILPLINHDNSLQKISELVAGIYAAEKDPVLRLIKLRKLIRAAWEKVGSNQATEQQRQDFSEGARKFFLKEYFIHLQGDISKDETLLKFLEKLFLFSFVEAVSFDQNAKIKTIPSVQDFMSTCRSVFSELKVFEQWERCYENYCNYIARSTVLIGGDELYCLGLYWNVQLLIKCNNGREYKTYTVRDPQLLEVTLINPGEIHWQVALGEDFVRSHRAVAASDKKTDSSKVPAASSSSSAFTSSPSSSSALAVSTSSASSSSSSTVKEVRGVYDGSLTQIMSNDEFEIQINRLANYLKEKHPKVKRVALFMLQSVEYMRCFFALHQAGMVPMPMSPDTDSPAERLASFVKGGEVELIITASQFKQHPFFQTQLAKTMREHTIFIDDEKAVIDRYPSVKLDTVNRDEDLAYIVNTSGSTGVPKQILVPHRGLKYCTDGHIDALKITAQDNIAAYADPAFDAHIIEMFIKRKTGCSIFVVPPDARRDIVKLSHFYKNNHITVGVFVASMLRQCKRKDFPDLRVVICTGEKIDDSIIKEWGDILLVDGYGPAENTIATWLKIISSSAQSKLIVIPNTEYFILEKEPVVPNAPKRVKADEEGEIYLAGSGLAIGYTDPKLTAERFVEIKHPDDPSRTIRAYKTRDVARQHPNGDVEIVGRLDRQRKVYGKLICPEEIETTIKEIEPTIKQVYVDVGINEKGHPEIIAYFGKVENPPLDLTALYNKLYAQLGQTFVPTQWVILPELPTVNGKVTIKGLPTPRELGAVRLQGSSRMLPKEGIETEIADLFYNVSGLSREQFKLHRDDDFFQLGCKSIQATMLLQILRDKYGLRLSYAEFTLIATIEQLAHAVTRVRNKTQLAEITELYIEQQEVGNAPIILFPSLLGGVTDYDRLKAVWNFPRSLYLMSARGIKNPDDMDNNLYAIAYDYYCAIKQKFPRGLKILAGWSMGGILATLVNYFYQLNGDNSAAVLMIDSESPFLFHSFTSEEYAKFLHDLSSRKLLGQFSLKEVPVSIAELSKLSKEQQIHTLFAAFETKLEEPNLSYKKGLLATVRGFLLGVVKFNLDRSITNVGLIAASETQSDRQSPDLGWNKQQKDASKPGSTEKPGSSHEMIHFDPLVVVTGNHESIMLDPNKVRVVADELQKYCKRKQDEFIVTRLANNAAWKRFPEIDREELKYYIPAQGSLSSNNKDKPFDLLPHVQKELQNPAKKVILLLGNVAVGKTTFLQSLAIKLQEERNPLDPIVLYIPLAKYACSYESVIKEHLRRLGYSDIEIEHLRKHQKFTIILDDFDEVDKDKYQNPFVMSRLFDEWDAKVIIGCRSSYLYNAQNYREIFYPVQNNKVIPKGLSEVHAIPFNDEQIEAYIKKFLENPPEDVEIDPEWKDYKKYLHHINSLPGLRELIRTPFLLRVLMEVLPAIVEEYEELPPEKRLPITQSKILDAFVARFWERQALKVLLARKRMARDVRIDYERFCIDLAQLMELENITQVIYRPDPDNPSKYERFFGEDEKIVRVREGALLKRLTRDEGGTAAGRPALYTADQRLKAEVVGFLHPILIKYFISRGIYIEFLMTKIAEEDARLRAELEQPSTTERFLLPPGAYPGTMFKPAPSSTASKPAAAPPSTPQPKGAMS